MSHHMSKEFNYHIFFNQKYHYELPIYIISKRELMNIWAISMPWTPVYCVYNWITQII